MSNKTKKNTYECMEHEEHIYKLPDTYISSVEPDTTKFYVYDNEKIISKEITYVPGFYKIVDEILSNAIDHSIRTLYLKEDKIPKTNIVTRLDIIINKESGYISVKNNGNGIVIEKQTMNNKTKIYTPELIFGVLLTSENYNKNDKKTSGKNGYGSKLSNIFSKEFIVETVDKKHKIKYTQKWNNNMKERTDPIIEKDCKEEPYTIITFLPDYERFGMDGLDDDIISLLTRRIYDTCLWMSNNGILLTLNGKPKKNIVDVYLNEQKLECNLENYINMYNTVELPIDKKHIFITSGYNWEIAITESPNNKFNQVSMVNGNSTFRGGKYLDYITTQFTKKCLDYIKSKKKSLQNIKPAVFKEYYWIFVKHVMESPTFDSQTKMYCSTNIKDNKFEFDDKFIEKFVKNTDIISKLEALVIIKDNTVKSNSNKNKSKIIVPKLHDANFAGTAKSQLCTLILTEGDSAMSSALSGLSAIKNGRDIYGVFPLKGKPLNVRGEKLTTIEANVEISNIMKIMGLNFNTEYTDTKKLRYKNIMILSDQDTDGFHIKGLLINFIDSLFPSLLNNTDELFITCLSTPIVKVSKGKETIKFYTLSDYENWKNNNENSHKYTIKYYKGLGTSNRIESQEYFSEMKLIEYYLDENAKQQINKVFHEDLADERKEWLEEYNINQTITLNESGHTRVSITDFTNLELKHFSTYDNIRSLPSLVDGLKPSQRKVLWSCFKKNLTKEIKVAQLAGYISEVSLYHHGEASLLGTIVAMAQDFVGTNNINLLNPAGSFGTRMLGGKDAASPRYIFTRLENITFNLFNKLDENILIKQTDENHDIEPEYYVPLLPMILINGSSGIGTGYSTTILQHNPIDIINNIRNLIKGKEIEEMLPYYRGFKGRIVKDAPNNYSSYGIITLFKKNILEISELPIGKWTNIYDTFLDKMYIDKHIESYQKYSTDIDIKYHITMKDNIEWTDAVVEKLIIKFKLKKLLSSTNMHLFNKDNKITKYNSVNDIITEFFEIRLEYYGKRRDYLLDKYNYDRVILENKIRFITEIINKKLIISNKSDDILLTELEDKDYFKKEEKYDYLLDMNLRSMTLKRLTDLQNQLDKLLETIDLLESKTPKRLYKDDLKEFEKEYKKIEE